MITGKSAERCWVEHSMTYYGDLYFFILLLFFLVPIIIINFLGLSKKYIVLLISTFVVYLATKDNPWHLLYLSIYIVYEFILIKLYLYLRAIIEKNEKIYYTALILSLIPLILYKVSGFFGYNLFGFLGISYLTFKSLQITIETYDGLIKEIKVIDYLNFMLFFPTISSGPIDRSRRFVSDLNAKISKKEYLELLGTGLFKFTQGILYKFVIANIIFGYMEKLDLLSLRPQVAYAFLYGLYLFFDFAGYSLLAIGTGYLIGVKIPENFNKPFLSVDIKDFWNRWHITLSFWFRDFLFTRLMIKFIKKKIFKSKITATSIGYIINMVVMGLWHGLTVYYILYGLYHGILLALTDLYQKKSAFYKKYKDYTIYKLISWVITMLLVFFGFFLFSGKLIRI